MIRRNSGRRHYTCSNRGRAVNSWANVDVLATAHAALDDASCPGSRIAAEAGSEPGGFGSREGSGAGGSRTLGSFRGFWIPAAWGRVMRTGVNVVYEPSGLKYELDVLANKDFRYLTKTYLPRKLKEEDWLD